VRKWLEAREKVLEFTIAYAKDRNAFGHPIGAYQSVQHRCADMVTDVDTSRLMTYRAAWRITEGQPRYNEIAIAKAWVGRAFRRIVTSSHQVHGAIGFTQDHVLHWYTKRARTQDVLFGDVDYQLSKLAELTLKHQEF
jgi:alkylation response protein AidB-like acyl-CoA dehydrogenase